MTQRDDDASNRFLPRIREELDKLTLTNEQKDVLAPALVRRANFLDTNNGVNFGQLRTDSSYFNFAAKCRTVVEHFEPHGLTLKKYLSAVCTQPHLIALNPNTVIKNIEEVVRQLAPDGLTTRDYLKAAVDEPTLFYAAPERIVNNIAGVAEAFADDGLTRSDYLNAALKTTCLFTHPAETIAQNVTGVVRRFSGDGLSNSNYIKAALKLPPLFYSLPSTVTKNITQVVERFADDGLTTREYLRSAVQQPSLFASSPETVSRHISMVMSLADEGVFVVPATPRTSRTAPTANRKHALVLEVLLKNPYLMCLADENYQLRDVHQRLTNSTTDSKFLTRPRHAIERELMKHLGHDDPKQPVPNDGFVAGQPNPTEEQARRFVLRALMHAGLIKGGSMER